MRMTPKSSTNLFGSAVLLAGLMTVTPAAAQAELPAAATLIDQFIVAMGGEEAIETIKNGRFKVTASSDMGDADLTVYFADENKLYVEVDQQGSEMTFGSDGKVFWLNSDMMGGYQLLEGQMADMVKGQISTFLTPFEGATALQKKTKTSETVELTDFNKQKCFKVKTTDETGKEKIVYFNAENHLLAGMESMEENPMMGGELKVVVNLHEYKKIEPITTFTKMTIEQGELGTAEVTYSEIELNTVDAAKFVLPDEVKKLLPEKPAEKPDDAGDDDADAEDDDGGGGGK